LRVRLSGREGREEGFALLLVLLTLGFLGLIVTQTISSARVEQRVAVASARRAMQDAETAGAVQVALFHLLADGEQVWPRNGRHVFQEADGGRALIVTRELRGLVNPNTAGPTTLAGLLGQCRLSREAALTVADALVAWRSAGDTTRLLSVYRGAGRAWGPNGQHFVRVEDLDKVLGMTPRLTACLAPHLSFYQLDDPDLTSPDPVVRAALTQSQSDGNSSQVGAQGEAPAETSGAVPAIGASRQYVVRIDVAMGKDGGGEGATPLVAIVSLGGQGDPVPYRILAWRRGRDGDDPALR